MLERQWELWRWLIRRFVTRGDPDERDPDDELREEGPIETAVQIGCLIVALAVGLVVLLAWLSRH